MAIAESIGTTYVEVAADLRRLQKDFETARKDAVKQAQTIEDAFKRRKIAFDNRFAKLKINELEKEYKRLQAELKKKLSLNVSTLSFKATKDELNRVEAALKDVKDSAGEVNKPDKFNFKNMALGAVAAYYSVKQLLNVVADLINANIDQAQSEARVRQAVETTGQKAGFTAGQILQYSKELSALSGIADGKVNNALGRLLGYTGLTGDMFKKAGLAVVDMAKFLDIDLGQAAEQVGNSLQYPSEAINSLTKRGFRFTNEQKRMILHFEQTNQVAKAQQIILDELNLVYGGQALKLHEMEKGTQDVANAWDDVKAAAGGAFDAMLKSSPFVVEMLRGLAQGIKLMTGELRKERVEAFTDSLKELRTEGEKSGQTTFQGLPDSVRKSIKEANDEEIAANKEKHKQLQQLIEDRKAAILEDRPSAKMNVAEKQALFLNDEKIKSLQSQQTILSQNNAWFRGENDALEKINKGIDTGTGKWTSQGKTIGEILDHIKALEASLELLSPDIDTARIKEIKKDIADLNKLIADEAPADVIAETIKKIQTENELLSLKKQLTIQALEASKQSLQNLLGIVKKREDELAVLQAIDKINKDLAKVKSIEIVKGISTEPPAIRGIEFPKGDVRTPETIEEEAKKRAEAENELTNARISAIENEFARREEQINLEFETEKKKFEDFYNQKLISETELTNAIGDLQQEKENELADLSREKFERGLAAARSIASAISGIVGSGNKFADTLNRALEIAEAIAAVIKTINILSSLFGNPTGITSAAPAHKEGGLIHLGKVTPYSQIPKFQHGINFRVANKYVNDSMLMRVSAREKVKVTPAHIADSSDRLLKGIYDRLGALNANVSRLDLQVAITNNAPEVETIVRRYKKIENKLVRAGKNLNEI